MKKTTQSTNGFKMDMARMFDILREMKIVPLDERHKLSLLNLKKGSFIQMGDNTLFIEDIYTYRDKKESWTEFKMVNVETLEVSFMEVEEDDSIIVTLTEKEIPMRNLPHTDDIEDMSEDEEGEIVIDGETYYYDDDYKAKFSREGSNKEEKVYFYDFKADNGKLLTIEEWGNKEDGWEYQAFISSEIHESSIEIMSL